LLQVQLLSSSRVWLPLGGLGSPTLIPSIRKIFPYPCSLPSTGRSSLIVFTVFFPPFLFFTYPIVEKSSPKLVPLFRFIWSFGPFLPPAILRRACCSDCRLFRLVLTPGSTASPVEPLTLHLSSDGVFASFLPCSSLAAETVRLICPSSFFGFCSSVKLPPSKKKSERSFSSGASSNLPLFFHAF